LRANVINLARSSQRRAHMIAQLRSVGIDYEFVTAIDGRDLDWTDPQTAEAFAPSYVGSDWFRPTRAGCALSHLSVYRKILADGPEHALVLEDDVTLPADLPAILDAVAERLTGAEVALLNFDSAQTCRVRRDDSADLPAGRQLVHPDDVNQPMSAAAYVITRQACKRMDAGRLPIRAKTDDWGHFHSAGLIDRLRCVVPLAVTKTPDFASTIGHHGEGSLKGRLLDLITRYHIRPLQRALALRRRWIWRSYTRVEFVGERPVSQLRAALARRPLPAGKSRRASRR
jgi:glycosyl transferase, family 25